MELDFDKEIDALLRQTARSGNVVSNQTAMHLDADEISAFAANALPEKTRQQYVAHLADCDNCRKNLSNLIALNAEQESEIIHAAREKQFVADAAPIPWYQKLFAVPNLVYTLGALVLVFSGLAIFTVLQNGGDSRNAEVSQTYDKQPAGGGKGMSSDGDAVPTSESYSSNMTSNTASMNLSAGNTMSASNTAMPSAPMMANSNMAAMNREPEKDLKAESRADKSLTEPLDLTKTENPTIAGAPVPPPAKENNFELDGAEQKQQPAPTTLSQRQMENLPKPKSVQSAPSGALRRAEDKNKKLSESEDDAQLRRETTSVGGKNFRRENNAWVDSAYRGQATTNISRGTKEYKKLDSGLRGIVENLGGTVIVVWKERAYRIQ